MSSDVTIIGGGHNGLVAASVLAKSGRKVTVLEARSMLGGLAAGDAFHPGYLSPGILHDTRSFREEVSRALKLSNYGLKRRETPIELWGVSEGKEALRLHEQSLSGPISADEQAAYAKFRVFIDRISSLVRHLTQGNPVNPLGAWWPLLSTGMRLRRLGPQDMNEFLRVGSMCVGDWMRDSFQDERVQALTAHSALIGLCAGPWSPWSAVNLIFHLCTQDKPIVGGSRALVAALVACAQANGVALRTDAEVKRIHLDAQGVCRVELATGEAVETRQVISTVDPVRTFNGLVGVPSLPVRLATDVRRIRTRGTAAKMHLALNGPLLSADGTPIEALRTGDTLDGLEKAYDGVKYGRLPERPMLDVRVPSLSDPSLAPEGHHVVSIMAHHVPYDLEGGWTEQAREELSQRILGELMHGAPGVRAQIVGRELLTPRDLEKEYGLTGGHIFHGEHAPDQLLFLRPTIQCSRFATPIKGLFLAGSGCHPGGGLTGMPGYLGAKAVLASK